MNRCTFGPNADACTLPPGHRGAHVPADAGPLHMPFDPQVRTAFRRLMETVPGVSSMGFPLDTPAQVLAHMEGVIRVMGHVMQEGSQAERDLQQMRDDQAALRRVFGL